MNVTLYSIIYMLGVLVMRGVVLYSAVVTLHLMSHKHNPNKLTPRLITSESNEHDQPTSTKHPNPDYSGRLYPLFTDPSLCGGQRHSPESNFYEEPPVVLSGIFDAVSEAIVAAMAKAERQAEWQSSWPPTYRRDWSNQQYFPLEILRSLPC